MGSSRYEAVITFLLQFDSDILLYILPVDFFFTLALIVILARNRRPLELVTLFALVYGTLFVVSSLIFYYVLDRPFALLEVYTFAARE